VARNRRAPVPVRIVPPRAREFAGFEACIAHLRLSITHRRATRTTNLLERLFVEERRRRRIIPNAFGEKAVLKLMLGAMTLAAERWRAIRISALRQELDHHYEATVGLAMTSCTRHQKLPAGLEPKGPTTLTIGVACRTDQVAGDRTGHTTGGHCR